MLIIAIAIANLLFFGGLLFWVLLVLSVKKEIKLTPRVPMFTCDIHGMFPVTKCFKLSVPTIKHGDTDLAVDVCPFCYTAKMEKAVAALKV